MPVNIELVGGIHDGLCLEIETAFDAIVLAEDPVRIGTPTLIEIDGHLVERSGASVLYRKTALVKFGRIHYQYDSRGVPRG